MTLVVLMGLVLSGVSIAGANEDGDPIDLGFPLNLAQQTYLETSLYSDGATKYPSAGSAYFVEYELNGQPYPGVDFGDPLEGRGPHGFYDTATFKCQTCHSPHAAEVGGSKLLRAGSTGCEYCHIGSSIASGKRVYQASDDPEALGDGNSGHELGFKDHVPNSTLTDFTLTCGSCHSVHGATSDLWYPADFFQPSGETTIADSTAAVGYKLLKADPSGLGSPAETLDTFRDVESSPSTNPLTVNQFAYSTWCATCHNVNTAAKTGYLGLAFQEEDYFEFDFGMSPHSNEHAVGYAGPHANPTEGIYNGPSHCYNCHRGGLTPIPVGLESGDTTQGALLDRIEGTGDGYLQNKDLDATEIACSRCHYATADFAADLNRLNGTADWPHSSSDDYALLGNWTLDPSFFRAIDVPLLEIPEADGGQMTATNWPRYLCGRCHVWIEQTGTGYRFERSRYGDMHTDLTGFTTEATGTAGLFGTIFSPGYSDD